jgi:hypothetical protein
VVKLGRPPSSRTTDLPVQHHRTVHCGRQRGELGVAAGHVLVGARQQPDRASDEVGDGATPSHFSSNPQSASRPGGGGSGPSVANIGRISTGNRLLAPRDTTSVTRTSDAGWVICEPVPGEPAAKVEEGGGVQPGRGVLADEAVEIL